MTDETFTIRAYGKSELAMMYFPDLSKETAIRKLISKKLRSYTPKQVRLIVEELGEPFEIE